jgi:hypothetical protein
VTPLTLLDKVVEALQAAGATEEMIAAAVGAAGEFRIPQRAKWAAKKRRQRAATRAAAVLRDGVRLGWPPPNAVPRDETINISLRDRLIDASNGNMDALSDISPIRALIEQGCDLEADVVPIVAREIPELLRPLKNWGAPWLVRDILAARDQRLIRNPQTEDN